MARWDPDECIACSVPLRRPLGRLGSAQWDLRDHDTAIVTFERDPTDATKTIRYVVVVLGSDRLNTQMAQLEIAYHDCIVAQHP